MASCGTHAPPDRSCRSRSRRSSCTSSGTTSRRTRTRRTGWWSPPLGGARAAAGAARTCTVVPLHDLGDAGAADLRTCDTRRRRRRTVVPAATTPRPAVHSLSGLVPADDRAAEAVGLGRSWRPSRRNSRRRSGFAADAVHAGIARALVGRAAGGVRSLSPSCSCPPTSRRSPTCSRAPRVQDVLHAEGAAHVRAARLGGRGLAGARIRCRSGRAYASSRGTIHRRRWCRPPSSGTRRRRCTGRPGRSWKPRPADIRCRDRCRP